MRNCIRCKLMKSQQFLGIDFGQCTTVCIIICNCVQRITVQWLVRLSGLGFTVIFTHNYIFFSKKRWADLYYNCFNDWSIISYHKQREHSALKFAGHYRKLVLGGGIAKQHAPPCRAFSNAKFS